MSTLKMDDCWNKIGVWGDQKPRCERLKKITHCHNCDIYSHAGSSLLSREIDQDYLNDWKKILESPRKNKNMQYHSVLIFKIEDEWFGIPSKLIKEITYCEKYHSLPHRKNNILTGLININGELLFYVSLKNLLKTDKADDSNNNTHKRHIIIKDKEETYAFETDEVKEIIHYTKSDIKPSPMTIKNDPCCFIDGIVRHNEENIGILNSQLLFSALHKSL